MRRTLYDHEHEMFRASVRTFIEREVLPSFPAWERAGICPKELFRRAAQAGLLGIAAPEEHGGGGTDDYRYTSVMVEEFCAAGVLNAFQGLNTHNDMTLPYIVDLGTEEQRARWLPGMCAGTLVGAVAMTEPAAGSDLSGITTAARRDGDHYVLNGSKLFTSNGINSDLVVVVCRTGPREARHRNLSLLVVEEGMPGFTRGRNLEKIGQHAADTGELFFDDVRVPVGNLLGAEGEGFFHLVSKLPQERLNCALAAVAHAEAAFGWTLAYCKERQAFGQPIGSFQHNRFALATMRTELDIAWVFTDRQVEAHCAGELTGEEAAEAKWWCTDLNRRVLDQCLQLHGGYGYMEEQPIARAWRDGRVMSIYSGTNEIMKEIIGRRTLGV